MKPTRRSFVRITSSLIALILFCAGSRAAEPERPNILWLVSEDNNPRLGCTGDTLVKTPAIDRLAKEGILYERCFAQPVCAPSRFALITGLYAVSAGPAEHMRAQGKIPAWLKGFPALLREAGYFTSNAAKTDYNSPIKTTEAWNENGKNAHYSHRAQPTQPFFSVFNHEVTHESCLFPAKSPALENPPTDPSKIRIPPYQPDSPEMRADWARIYDCLGLMDAQVGAKLKDLEKNGLAENTIVFYYGDNGGILPRSKRFLQQSGTHVPLVVYFPPKWRHLAPAAPGSRITEPVCFVDFAPTILSLAGLKIPEYMQGRAFAGIAKAQPNTYVFATRDRMDESYDMLRSVMDSRYLYIRNFRPDIQYVQRLDYMFKARGYQSWARLAAEGKLTPATAQFWGEKPSEELYDMAADPDSVTNLAGDPAHKAALERMRAALKEHTLAVNDNGFLPEGSDLEGYEASRKPGAFPLERIYDLALLASERNPAHALKFVVALEDPHEAMRWWAAQGLAILGKNAATAESALTKALDDPFGPVQIEAAEALLRLDKSERAAAVLEKWIRTADKPFFALQAANVVSRNGSHARAMLPAFKQVLASVQKEPGANNPRAYLQRILERLIAESEGRETPLVYPSFASPAKDR